jgi:hypothetical protein
MRVELHRDHQGLAHAMSELQEERHVRKLGGLHGRLEVPELGNAFFRLLEPALNLAVRLGAIGVRDGVKRHAQPHRHHNFETEMADTHPHGRFQDGARGHERLEWTRVHRKQFGRDTRSVSLERRGRRLSVHHEGHENRHGQGHPRDPAGGAQHPPPALSVRPRSFSHAAGARACMWRGALPSSRAFTPS